MSISFKNSIVLFALIFWIGVRAQETLHKTNWLTQENGLLESTNAFVFKDKVGMVWISSLDGLQRFDGRGIKWFQSDTLNPRSVYGNNIQSQFFENSKGDIWFVSEDAINCYRCDKGYFDHYFIRRNLIKGKREQYYAFHLEQDRYLWVRADDFLYRFDTYFPNDQNKIKILHPFEGMRCTVQSWPNGKVKRVIACFWDLKAGVEVIDYNPDYSVQKRSMWFNGEKQESLNIRHAAVIGNVIWLCSNKGLVSSNDFKSIKYAIFPLHQGDDKGIRTCIQWDGNRLLVLTQEKGEIHFFSPSLGNYSQALEVQPLDNDFPNKKIRDIYLFGNEVWGAAYGQGVFFAQLYPDYIQHPLQMNHQAPISINQIWEDPKDQIWCVADNGLTRIFDKKLKIIRQFPGPDFARFYQDETDQLWCYSNEGLAELDLQSLKLNPIASMEKRIIYDVENLGANQLLLATNNGILIYNKKQAKTIKLFPMKGVNVLHRITEHLFLVGTNTQLVLFNPFSDRNIIHKLETGFVTDIVDTPLDSSCWVSTLTGIHKINRFTLKEDKNFKQNPELKHAIKSLALDDNGILWLSGNRGIYAYSPAKETLAHYMRKDGLFSSEYNFESLFIDKNGHIWAGGNNGVDVINAQLMDIPNSAPTLVLNELKIHDKNWTGETSIEKTKEIRLPYHQNTLKFEMSALDFQDPARNQFKVYLAGYDQQWTKLGYQNFITYANLPPGYYRFLFTASNAQGTWQRRIKDLKVTILPPYWRTWWFYTLMLSLVVLFVNEFFRYRTSQRKKQEKIRKQIARDLHDEMGSTLSSISILSDAIYRKYPDDHKFDLIQTISERAREVMETMSDIVWSVNPKNDAMGVVVQKMRSFASETLEAKDIVLYFETDPTLDLFMLPMEHRKDFYLFFKEAINNAAKYSQASQLWVTIQKTGTSIELVIRDNGKGFKLDQIKSGNGLGNLQERATRLQGKMHLETKIGVGTSVDLTFPINP